MMADVRVNRNLTIPDSELRMRFTTSGGPGGQHANKSSTRVELLWNVDDSTVLGPRQRVRIKGALKRRIDSSGDLHLISDIHRSQMRNRVEVETRLGQLIADALRPVKSRVPTKPSRSATQRRIESKKKRGEIKRSRTNKWDD
jgi:ribosome-associated protein